MTGPSPCPVNPHVQNIAVLQRKPLRDQALGLLKDIAQHVSYLMKENRFRVGLLVEFYPRDKRLLGMNMNRGYKIMLRLRSPNDEFQFLPRESIIGTMLHELTHNLHGAHDNRFYAKLDDLMARQWVIEQQGLFDTFLGEGRRLGGTAVAARERQVSLKQRRGRARSRGRKLGGSSSGRNGSPREMAALAADRRARDSRTCADANAYDSDEEDLVVIDESAPRPEPVIEVIDLT
ncbi:WSS1 (YHR134W) [Zygosaccharomyces parabailii]|nr:WSS1 (YHR134W) [Zygosaccharomyces parabailii]CDH09209.1 related to DNA damage response protein WSS1 [Zygosaccharomyces bailii ISA1307]